MLKSRPILIIGTVIFFSLLLFLGVTYHLQKQLINIYESRESLIIRDRYGQEIFIKPNQRDNLARYLEKIPPKFAELLIKKEDKLFYYHFGFNPWSISQAALHRLGIGQRKASSTITQQLVKNLLGRELERSLKNKIVELIYALSLETYQSKENILKMYLNSIYLGNQVQGVATAAQFYFGLSPELLTDGQILQILATISSPSQNNPAEEKNTKLAISIAERLNLDENIKLTDPQEVKENIKTYSHFSESYFEIKDLIGDNLKAEELTIDKDLTEKIRKIVQRNLKELKEKKVKNAALIVIKLPENEILSLIGSPDPYSFEDGYQINLLRKARAIGSTIKPFIYLKAFEKGLRPYTLVEDREYRYVTALGFPLYPKNFDYKYRGEINLHYALSNSLNVPTVKVLEYLGLENFYQFLEEDLEFKSIQDLENYQLGIALGGLEMSLMDLSHFFTIFSNKGILRNLKIYLKEENFEKRIADPEYIQLVNKILQDRKTGVDQFGLKSELNLFQENYALKTGTSREFKDSWIIGYTPDFLVGVWIGNADLTSMDAISGQQGAGRIWSEVMELLFNSEYNKKTPFEFNLIEEFYQNGHLEYGLGNDDFEKGLNTLKERESVLILNPHQGDSFLFERETKIILKARENVNWFVNEEFFDIGNKVIFIPEKPGQYQIKAEAPDGFQEKITIWIIED